MLGAGVRAAGDVDPHVTVEAAQARLQILDELAGEALGLGQRELAELAAGAGHGAAPEG